MTLNEDFFDDNDIVDDPDYDPVHDPNDDPDYTYHLQFIILVWPLIDTHGSKDWYFQTPKYKSAIEPTFISMKKALGYILKASPVVTDYSEPKFCSTIEDFIKEFPYMDNEPSFEFIPDFKKEAITLETTFNLSKKKNVNNLTRLFYSFWRLQQIYDKLLVPQIFGEHQIPYIKIGVFRKNPYRKANIYGLLPPDKKLSSGGLELINVLNYKDETTDI